MLVLTFAAPTVSRGVRLLMIEQSTNSECFAERRGRIESSAIFPQRHVRAPECRQIGFEKCRDATDKCQPLRPLGKSCPSRFEWPCVGALDPLPELVQCGEAMRRLVACDDAGVDSTNRGTDDPIGLDPCFVQGLIYTNLVGPQGLHRPEGRVPPVHSPFCEIH